MPPFAAKLGFLFQEVDLLERYNAADRVGFRGVEPPFPYSIPPEALAARLQSCGLEQVLCNLPPGDWAAGERGLGAVPGIEEAFAKSLEQALTYARTLSCPRLHAMAGEVAEVRSQVHGVQPGDRVAVNFYVTCGCCQFCRVGRDTLRRPSKPCVRAAHLP